MTKRIISILLTLTMVFAFASCGNPKNDTPPKMKGIDFSKIDTIEVTWNTYPVSLSDEQVAYVISLWREGEWSPNELKISPDYEIKAGEFDFYYDLSLGMFLDLTYDSALFLSDEQREVFNSYLTTVSADAITQITVGMTLAQVRSILRVPEKSVGYDEATREITLEYKCDDGSKFNIVVVYGGDGIQSTIVTSITKIDTEA